MRRYLVVAITVIAATLIAVPRASAGDAPIGHLGESLVRTKVRDRERPGTGTPLGAVAAGTWRDRLGRLDHGHCPGAGAIPRWWP